MLDEETRKLIEKLLLRGERLLGETCPVCGTPLILLKEVGLKFCPKCKRYVITSEAELLKARELGIQEADMILVNVKPEGSAKTEAGDPIERLIRRVVELVESGRLDEARRVAEIVGLICRCRRYARIVARMRGLRDPLRGRPP